MELNPDAFSRDPSISWQFLLSVTHEKVLPIPDCRFAIGTASASSGNNPNGKLETGNVIFGAVPRAPSAHPMTHENSEPII
jgi:hypothetical protein